MATLLPLIWLLITGCLVHAICIQPAVRKEWRTLSWSERADWIRSVKCLANLPHDDALAPSVPPSISNIVPVNTSSSYYDDFVYLHMDLNTKIHFTGLFLPWHRWYVAVYERALKEKCGYKGTSPYWDWVQDYRDVFSSTMFTDPDPESGLGGWGDPANDVSVPDGGFSNTSTFRLAYPSPHTLRRNFTLKPFLGNPFLSESQQQLYGNTSFTPAERDKLVNGFVGDFKGFQTYLEGFNGSHGAIHLMVGGDLGGICPASAPPDCVGGPTFSANEPLFWMHHAMVDKLWYDWQHASPHNGNKFFGGSVEALNNVTSYEQYPTGAAPFLSVNSTMPADGLFESAKIGDVLSTTNGLLCYVYE
ncbi:Di-copper centre-containing protein [Mycena indigotica]|uniref:Di-copper centre-containing protein n=1 Tax=Mycena indigotica TaxID=2126181 RepID=A0A8H6SNJ8_9AGAR|nr:Di-copper centre-containing protein [Mycena indigotica]KAF7302077.1 Di-copper centre-containing protein [Mycena indigotica]